MSDLDIRGKLDILWLRRSLRPSSTAWNVNDRPNLWPALSRCAQDPSVLRTLLPMLTKAASDGGPTGAPRALIALAETLGAARQSQSAAMRLAPPAVPLTWLATGGSQTPTEATTVAEYEAAAAHAIAACVATAEVTSTDGPSPKPGAWASAIAPARVDLAGGWSDTPPICYEAGGRVCNLAIRVDGAKPIGARARRKPDALSICVSALSRGKKVGPPLVLSSLAQFGDVADPTAPGALAKAVLLTVGAVVDGVGAPSLEAQLQRAGGGLEIETWSDLPQGSGLGTSSILAAALVAAVVAVLGRKLTMTAMTHAVLKVEQCMTTGGGWQDQLGGLVGGAKLCTCPPSLPLRVSCRPLELSDDVVGVLNDHLQLIFTGKVRLAKNLLRDVLRRWLLGRPASVRNMHALLATADGMAKALVAADIDSVGAHLRQYWEQKKRMCDAEPGYVTATLKVLYDRQLISGASLAGAGGGGFLLVVTRRPHARAELADALSGAGIRDLAFHDVAVDEVGMELSLGGASVPAEKWDEWTDLF